MRQVDAATFHAAVEEAEGLVVVDFYTQNCGPCRLMYPKVVEMANLFKVDGVTFLKMLCSQDNKEIGKAFKVRVAPTFVLLQGGKEVARMTGAHGESRRGPTARPATSPGGSHAATDPRLTGPPPRRPQPTNSSSWSRSTSKVARGCHYSFLTFEAYFSSPSRPSRGCSSPASGFAGVPGRDQQRHHVAGETRSRHFCFTSAMRVAGAEKPVGGSTGGGNGAGLAGVPTPSLEELGPLTHPDAPATPSRHVSAPRPRKPAAGRVAARHRVQRFQVQNTGVGGAYGGGPLKPAPDELAPPEVQPSVGKRQVRGMSTS